MRKVLLLAYLLAVAMVAACGSDSEQKAEEEPGYAGGTANDTGPRIAVTCGYSLTNEADMIFKPTTKPPAHQHDIYGPERFGNELEPADLLGMGTTCKQVDEGDHSAWWRPAATWGGQPVRPATKLVIYLDVTKGISAEKIRPFPVGFEDVSRRPTFRCNEGEWVASPPNRCAVPQGQEKPALHVRLVYDQCLNPDDKSVEANTARVRNGACPSTHPVLLPAIQSTGTYRLPKVEGPLRVAGTTGDSQSPSTMHEDFVNGWDQAKLKELVGLCLRQTGQQERRPERCRTSDRDVG